MDTQLTDMSGQVIISPQDKFYRSLIVEIGGQTTAAEDFDPDCLPPKQRVMVGSIMRGRLLVKVDTDGTTTLIVTDQSVDHVHKLERERDDWKRCAEMFRESLNPPEGPSGESIIDLQRDAEELFTKLNEPHHDQVPQA